MAGVANPRNPGLERIEAADGRILLAVDRNLLDRLGACFGERHRGALEARGFVLPVAGLFCRWHRLVAGKQIVGSLGGFRLGSEQSVPYVALATCCVCRNISRID